MPPKSHKYIFFLKNLGFSHLELVFLVLQVGLKAGWDFKSKELPYSVVQFALKKDFRGLFSPAMH